ncbi:hypothetical protein JCM3770_005708 [Rhodotorula araucariae]
MAPLHASGLPDTLAVASSKPTTAGTAGSAPANNGATGAASRDDQQISQILAEMSQQQNNTPEATSSRPKRAATRPAQTSPVVPAYSLGTAGPSRTTAPYEAASIAAAALAQPFFPQVPHNVQPPAPSTSATALGPAISLSPSSTTAGAAPPPTAASTSTAPTPVPAERDELSASPGLGGPGSSARSAAGKARASRGRGRGKSDERMGMNEDEWERSRKDNHKEVERRRRETINAGITQLATLLPPETSSGTPSLAVPALGTAVSASAVPTLAAAAQPSASAASKVNKSHTLARAASYITQLREEQARTIDQWTLEKLLADQTLKGVREENDRLQRENDALRAQVARLGGSGEGAVNGVGKRVAPDEEVDGMGDAASVKKARVDP